MSSTAPLTVLGDYGMDEKTVCIHPNDGFELGLKSAERLGGAKRAIVRFEKGDRYAALLITPA